MATRPVFLPDPDGSLVRELPIEFEWHAGFAQSQKQKSIIALHEAAATRVEGGRFLEISTKSPERLGWTLSAFNLMVTTASGCIPVEAAFQGSKVFSESGQHPELYEMGSGRDIKKRIGEFANEAVTGFRFEDRDWAPEPTTAFYDWLYLCALIELDDAEPTLTADLRGYAGFTDIEFNPRRSLNCQARSCALFVALSASVSVRPLVGDPERFVGFLSSHEYWGVTPRSPKDEDRRLF